MIDIITVEDGDVQIYDTQTERAKNILSVQWGSLEYAQTFGIDLKYFLSEDFRFQDASFQSYMIQILANYGINVAELTVNMENLFSSYVFNLLPPERSDGLIAR